MIDQRLGRSASFSPCRTFRYTLVRELGAGPALQVIGLNPSTADKLADDPTIRRCIGVAGRWGFGRLVVTNLFAFRATGPGRLRAAADPVGPDNDWALVELADRAAAILAAWGCHGACLGRARAVRDLLGNRDLLFLGETRGGQPRHPLYVPGDRHPIPYRHEPAIGGSL
jgi:hypothetical protein